MFITQFSHFETVFFYPSFRGSFCVVIYLLFQLWVSIIIVTLFFYKICNFLRHPWSLLKFRKSEFIKFLFFSGQQVNIVIVCSRTYLLHVIHISSIVLKLLSKCFNPLSLMFFYLCCSSTFHCYET